VKQESLAHFVRLHRMCVPSAQEYCCCSKCRLSASRVRSPHQPGNYIAALYIRLQVARVDEQVNSGHGSLPKHQECLKGQRRDSPK